MKVLPTEIAFAVRSTQYQLNTFLTPFVFYLLILQCRWEMPYLIQVQGAGNVFLLPRKMYICT